MIVKDSDVYIDKSNGAAENNISQARKAKQMLKKIKVPDLSKMERFYDEERKLWIFKERRL